MKADSNSGAATREAISWGALAELCALRPATEADVIDGVMPEKVAVPETTEQLSAALAWANTNGAKVVPRGGGTKLQWGNVPSAADVIASLEKFRSIRDHAWQDMTVTIEAGVNVAALQRDLARHGQRLPLDVLWPERSTVGGVIATNDSGALRLRFGSVRDLILGATVVLADGTIARSGGRVVKNVAGYDLPKLFAGSMGTLGVITEVTLRTYPLPHCTKTIRFGFGDIRSANRLLLAVADTTLVPASMQMRVDENRAVFVDICFEGLDTGIAAQVVRASELAVGGKMVESAGDVWRASESLWGGTGEALVGKFSVLPSNIADAVEAIQERFVASSVIAQSHGIGFFRGGAKTAQDLQNSIDELRKILAGIGGSVVLLQAPLAVKKCVDVFGVTSTAQPLMERVKYQFDPKGTLSPGRFLGGI